MSKVQITENQKIYLKLKFAFDPPPEGAVLD